MEHKHLNTNIQEIKAESIVALYDLQNFAVEMKSIFYRNYSPDLMSNPNNKEVVELSRDGIFHLLPEGLFFEKDDKKFQEKKEKAMLFFQPFDTEYFNLSLKLEKEINRICEKYQFSLTDFLCGNVLPKSEENILNFISLSNFVNTIRGNETLIIDILKNILNVPKIELVKNINSTSEGIIRKTFIIHISNLSAEEYARENQRVSKLFEIIKDNLLPFEIEYSFEIKDKEQEFKLGENLILGYNTNI
ncbi:MAG: hypothetical protein FWD02_06150 [Bacteroidales bacterium]|nr:hypothetical protein [Bacteroidales bacterium]